jgi:DNA-binding beta-propeller fold protein YncE
MEASGRSVYVTGEYGASVTHFERDAANGALTQRDCLTANTNVAGCTPLPGAAPGATNTMLAYAEEVVASADGLSVYVAGYDGTLLRFTTDHDTGALTFRDCFTGNSTLSGGCAAVPGAATNGVGSPLASAYALAISPDDRNVYVGAYAADAVTRFDRELAPSNEFTFGKLKRNKRKGTAKLTVEVPGPGTITIEGKGLKAVARDAGAAAAVKLPVKAKGKAAKKLRRRGKLKALATVTFTPSGGIENAKTKRVKLVRRP